jgi:hypothetical protein
MSIKVMNVDYSVLRKHVTGKCHQRPHERDKRPVHMVRLDCDRLRLCEAIAELAPVIIHSYNRSITQVLLAFLKAHEGRTCKNSTRWNRYCL